MCMKQDMHEGKCNAFNCVNFASETKKSFLKREPVYFSSGRDRSVPYEFDTARCAVIPTHNNRWKSVIGLLNFPLILAASKVKRIWIEVSAIARLKCGELIRRKCSVSWFCFCQLFRVNRLTMIGRQRQAITTIILTRTVILLILTLIETIVQNLRNIQEEPSPMTG